LRVRYFPTAPPARNSTRFARQFLWHAGLDFDHGTGHGVGSYLSVHEGPARISKIGTTPLKRGMILSNEPGYYKTDAFGIRIENLELVVEARIEGAERPMNGFETLTLAPIDRRLINAHRISKRERDWIDAYHARVREAIRPLVDEPPRCGSTPRRRRWGLREAAPHPVIRTAGGPDRNLFPYRRDSRRESRVRAYARAPE